MKGVLFEAEQQDTITVIEKHAVLEGFCAVIS